MRVTEKLVAASLLALMAGCSSWNPFASKDPKVEPAKLVELKSSIAVRDAWKYSIGKAGVYALTPALAGSSLYVVSADGALARLDAASGRETWRIKAGSDITSGAGSDGAVVAVGAAKGAVLAFDADGKQLWKAQASSEVLTAPVVGQGVVVVRSVDNRIVGFDAKTGERKWTVQRATPALTLRNAPGMVLGGANIYVAQPGGKLLALTAATGVVRWEIVVSEPRGATELERVSDIAGTPVVFEGEVCAVTYQGKAGCFDAATGVPRWTKPISSDVGVAVDQRFVFVADDQGAVVAFSREAGQSAWKNEALGRRRLSTPASYGRSVAVGDYQGYIHFLSREDGALIGRVSTDGSPIVSAPVVAGSNLIFQTQSGTVTALAVE
ncbi:outer membrane protein assembly factor BamB [Janthinobacterium sp. FW305-128]|uniref:outer membrane protein assembly factor BamB n=1 Tax=Janthinobacterium sp. FW305-128 TaxID=2775055 RepID=UPI001E3303AD|nr:outer membrane protein assembly factor BamB [Janthinobacterium sp. FW305-128]MCC7682038.1 outer membrane protein assembly factor BamB [Janthinobacterium sp. FW305-128]